MKTNPDVATHWGTDLAVTHGGGPVESPVRDRG